MDILTHAVMGAAMAAGVASVAYRGPQTALVARRRLAAGIGAAAGLLPDADVLIQSGGDALLLLDFHRHFTHAMAFVPVGALVAALLLWPFVRRRTDFGLLYLYCLAAYLPQPLLDACTSYGTYLWLPFSQRREAWNLIAVVDPLFTLLLAVPLFLYLRRTDSRAVRWGLLLGACYLGLSFVQQQRGEAALAALAQARGHQATQVSVKPSMANLVLWRSLYVHDGQVQVDAFHLGPTLRHYPGASAPLLDAVATQKVAAGEAMRLRDIERFRIFSDGFLVLDARRPGFVGDARYAMQPTAIAPIWGLEWRGAGAATEFVSRHDFSPAMRRDFLAMLLGRDLAVPH
ncbi:MAG: metal-dependent hydrolase [Sulfuritalea sp.]|nr:metal-dependent hydrolase [Sulfuritalea sp.]